MERVSSIAAPGDWARESGADFIDFVAENLHTRKTGIYKSSKARADRGGGTFAHWQIALAYAKYLSPELHMQVNEVNARELHDFLGSKQEFANWIKNRIEQYGFVEGQDFTVDKFINGRATQIDYHLTIDMAKELAMVERNA